MQSFRKGNGNMFRLPVRHIPTPLEVSQQAFDRNPPVYDKFDEVEFHFTGHSFCGELFVAVVAYPPRQDRCLIIDPFRVPDGKKHLIPPFPEEE